jgi:hypothetical protein
MPTFDWFENESKLKPWTFKLSKESWNFQTVKCTLKICQGGKRFGGYKARGELFRMYSEDPKHCFFGCEIFSKFHFLKIWIFSHNILSFPGNNKKIKKTIIKIFTTFGLSFRLVTFWKIVLLLFV